MADFESESLDKLEQVLHPGNNEHKIVIDPTEDPYVPKMKRKDVEPRNVTKLSGPQERVVIIDDTPVKTTDLTRSEIDEMLVREFIKFNTLMRAHLTESMSFSKGPVTIAITIRQ